MICNLHHQLKKTVSTRLYLFIYLNYQAYDSFHSSGLDFSWDIIDQGFREYLENAGISKQEFNDLSVQEKSNIRKQYDEERNGK